MERGTEYQVNGVDFDGYDATRRVLLDAKDWKGYPPSGAAFWHEGVLKEIDGQLRAAGETPIEWHFSTEVAKRKVDAMLKKESLEGVIRTVTTPFEL
jgi:hypothetical protein